jgi:hypothetical protein
MVIFLFVFFNKKTKELFHFWIDRYENEIEKGTYWILDEKIIEAAEK